MDILLLIIAVLLIILGFLGCLLPVLPGPPLSYGALVIIHFTRYSDLEISTIIYLGILTIIVQVLDSVVPVWGVKKFGGSKQGAWGSMLGFIAGLFFLPAIGPFGIITILGGPFVGALIGEIIAGKGLNIAMRAAFGSFVGFLAGTFMKLACAGLILLYFIKALEFS